MKGLVFDVFTIFIVVLIVGISAVAMYFVLGQLETAAAGTGTMDTSILNSGRQAMLVFNYGLLFLLFGGIFV